jgi:hypothetical protein
MRTVRTEDELKAAFAAKEEKILVKGPMAEKMIKRAKTKKAAKIGGIAMIVASLAAIPFTFGASAAGVATGMGLTIGGGTLVLSAGELAILCAFALGVYGLSKDSKVTFRVTNEGPEVEIDPKYKG